MTEPTVLPPTTPPAAAPEPGDGWQVRFFAIWTGQTLSLIGSALTQFVLIWWITQATGSASALATAGIMALLPQALLGPLGGTFADRFSRRAIMIIADLIAAACILVLIVLFARGAVQLWHLYTMMFIRSSMQAFQAPAAAASTSMLVPPDWLPRAAGMNQTSAGLMSIIAAPLGALALARLPLHGALLIDVATALLGLIPLCIFRLPQITIPRDQRARVWDDFRAGLRLVTGHPGLLRLYGITTLLILVVMPPIILVPLLVKDYFGGGVNEVAFMEGAFGVGTIAGGLAISLVMPRGRRIVTALIAFALSCAAISLAALMPGNLLLLAAGWWLLSGVAFAIGNAPLLAIIQTIVPNHLQGRALSLFSTLIGLATPFGLALAAPLGSLFGVRELLIGGGLLGAAVCLLGFCSPLLLRVEETDLARPTGTPAHPPRTPAPPRAVKLPDR